MAKSSTTKTTTTHKKVTVPVRRPGVVAKTRNSKIKGSRNYVKQYTGQGR
jgi:hypothetical protein